MSEERAIAAGIVFSALFHVLLGTFLFAAASAGGREARVAAAAGGPRRAAHPEQALHDRRILDGTICRLDGFTEESRGRRSILDIRGRRRALDEVMPPLRFIELAAGRRSLAFEKGRKERSIDFGEAARSEVLQAMLIPRLGMKQADPKKLPKLTKYEQPEKMEAGINISRENPDGEDLKHKAFEHKKSEADKRRKKPASLSELIDSPEDDDPRKRPTMLEEIVGRPDGSVHGDGTEGRAGDLYLAQVELALRGQFNIPVFITPEELKKLVVDIEISRIDSAGRVLEYRIIRDSSSAAYNSAALEAVKRFVTSEGGSRTLPPPTPEMLEYINRRGILVRLEGKRMKL